MHPLIYIAGDVADAIGKNQLKELANDIATRFKAPVEILTHGESQYHGTDRIIGKPQAVQP